MNPDTLRAQIQSGIMFGLTAALYGEIMLKEGLVEQSSFGDYRILRVSESPAIEVHIGQSAEVPAA